MNMDAIWAATDASADVVAAATDSLQNDIIPTITQTYGSIAAKYNDCGVSDFVTVYIIPSITNAVGEDGSVMFANALKSTFNSVSDHVLVIDCNEFMTADSFSADGVHLNDSGHRKLSAKIADALYDYYN